jgi:hypothetical protein
MIIKGVRHKIKSYYWIWTWIFQKKDIISKQYLDSLICTLDFELFIMSGPLKFKANNHWWSEVARVDFFSISPFVPHVIKVALSRITPLHLWAHTSLKCLHVTLWAFVWEPKVSAPLDVVLCVYSFVVCSKHLLALDVAKLCHHLPMLQGFLFCSKPLNFFICGLVKAFPKLLFVVVVLIFTILSSLSLCCLFLVDLLLYT